MSRLDLSLQGFRDSRVCMKGMPVCLIGIRVYEKGIPVPQRYPSLHERYASLSERYSSLRKRYPCFPKVFEFAFFVVEPCVGRRKIPSELFTLGTWTEAL